MKKLLVLVVFVTLGLIATSSAKSCTDATVFVDCQDSLKGPGSCVKGQCDWNEVGFGSYVN